MALGFYRFVFFLAAVFAFALGLAFAFEAARRRGGAAFFPKRLKGR
jgi:hypothetical protein